MTAPIANSSELMTARVHSLVVFGISDHWMRSSVQHQGAMEVVGAIFGKRAGNDVDVVSSFEMKPVSPDGASDCLIDEEFRQVRIELLKEMLPDHEFLGFYITGDSLAFGQRDECLQRQALKHAEAPILLKLNPHEPVARDKISIAVYRFGMALLEPTQCKVISDTPERIGVDHSSRFSNMSLGGSGERGAMKSLAGHLGAANSFISGVTTCFDYVKDSQEGRIRPDVEILRDICKLNEKLSAQKSKELSEAEDQAADQKLTMLLTAMAGVEGSTASLISKLNVLNYDRHGMQMGAMKKHLPRAAFGGLFDQFLM